VLALKLTLVPTFLLALSFSGRWWGPMVAGWLAGLPVVAGPILFLLVLERGPEFGSRAAIAALSAILASEAFNLVYAWTCRARPPGVAALAGLTAWFGAACGLTALPSGPLAAALAAVLAVAVSWRWLPRAETAAGAVRLTKADLTGRLAAGAALTLAVTGASAALGPTWAGLLTMFPLLGLILSVSSHRAHGPDFVIRLLRGMVMGRFAFAAFCLSLVWFLPRQSAPVAFLAAAALSVLVQGLTRRLTVR
jgi:hypothetical protein